MQFEFQLPAWLIGDLNHYTQLTFASAEAKMSLVLKSAKHNILTATGGPFAAAIFHNDQLISLGVNLVVNQKLTVLHAEMVAIMLANRKLHHYDLASFGQLDLYTSSFPCGMCMGAIIWSGIAAITYATSSNIVENHTGFDEGIKVTNLSEQLFTRGITVNGPILEAQGIELLQLYMQHQQPIYNSLRNTK
jgi:tRNA(Arg) A34 adenosine deaminase TadA